MRPIEVVEEYWRTFDRLGFKGVLAQPDDMMARYDDLFTPDCELHTPATGLEGGPHIGREGFLRWWRYLGEVWQELDIEIDENRLLQGDAILSRGRIHAQGRTSGVDIDSPFYVVFRFHKERICRMRILLERDQAERLAASIAEGEEVQA